MNTSKNVSGSAVAKVVLGLGVLLVLIGCAFNGDKEPVPKANKSPSVTPTTDVVSSTSGAPSIESTFIPKNADGYPELRTTNKNSENAINQQLLELVDRWLCSEDADAEFEIVRHAVSDKFLSVKYSAIHLCNDMPSPNSTDNALTFSIDSGKRISLASLTGCASEQQLLQKLVFKNIKPTIDECPAPEMTGDFFLDNDEVTLINFYRDHFNTGCEFEVVKSLSEISCP